MLDLMRKHAGTWMIKALLGAIVVVFVFWGVGSWTSQREGIVATVNGESISLEDYRNAYNRLMDQARQSLGSNLSDEMLKTLQLPKRAMEQLIDRTLLKQAAERLKMQVTDEELAQSIRSTPAFQAEGVFDRRRYQQVLSLNRTTPEVFELNQRDSLLVGKLVRLVTDTVKVSETEAESWYQWNHAAIRFDFVTVDAERTKNISVTADEVAHYFERTKQAYQIPPEVQVRYVRFDPEAYSQQIQIPPEEIRDYYEANLDRFVIAPTVEASHILIRVPDDADPAAVEKAREHLQTILKQAREGQDFAQLAKQYSEDEGTKEKGGALGAFPKEAMVPPFGEVAFATPPGQISEPVRTRFGWHLIQVAKVNEGRTRSVEEAHDEIQNHLKNERARSLAYDDAEAVYDGASVGNDLVGAAAARQLEVRTTEFFGRNGPVKGIAQGAAFAQAAFQVSPGIVGEIQDFGDGYYLLQTVENRPARIPELAAVEARVKQDLIREKQREQARKDAHALLEDLKGGVAWEQAAKKLGLAPRAAGFLKRNDPIADLGPEPEMLRIAFERSGSSPLPAEPIPTAKGFAVVRFGERRPADMAGFEQERTQIVERLLQQKKFKAWEAWMSQLRDRSQVDQKRDFNLI
jgi:peptidyl-prolyl cis-trans isomerase D